MRFGKAAMAAVLVAAAVTVGGCDGPLMMSDETTETEKAQPDQGGAVKDPGSAGDRME